MGLIDIGSIAFPKAVGDAGFDSISLIIEQIQADRSNLRFLAELVRLLRLPQPDTENSSAQILRMNEKPACQGSGECCADRDAGGQS